MTVCVALKVLKPRTSFTGRETVRHGEGEGPCVRNGRALHPSLSCYALHLDVSREGT